MLQMEPPSSRESRPLLTQSVQSLNVDHGSTSDNSSSVALYNNSSMHNPAVDDEQGRTKEETFDPHGGGSGGQTTNFQTMMHLLKSNLGTGILAMPRAFSNAGIGVGTAGIPIMGIICIHCMHILVTCSKNLCKRTGLKTMDYAHVIYYAFKHGPERTTKFAKHARRIINFFLLLTQFGFCCVYFVFVATTLKETIQNLGGPPISFIAYASIVLPFMILLNMIRDLRTLAIFSTFANVAQFFGLGVVFYNVVTDLPSVDSRPASVSISRLPLYFGVAVYAFEGIGVVLPLENKMENPEDFGMWNGVLNTGMIVVTALYTAMGFYGYLKFGDDALGSVTLNLGKSVLNEIVRLVFGLAIFLSYSIQLYVPMQIIWPILKEKLRLDDRFGSRKTQYLEYLFRFICVVCTFFFAISIPDLELFISLVGALASSSLALIIPPILQTITYWNEEERRWMWGYMYTKNVLIGVFGLIGFVTGTYATIEQLINKSGASISPATPSP